MILDKWQFMDIEELRMNMVDVDASTRTDLNNILNDWFKEHDGCVWGADMFISLFTFFGAVCSHYGYVLKFKRYDNIMLVLVVLNETV